MGATLTFGTTSTQFRCWVCDELNDLEGKPVEVHLTLTEVRDLIAGLLEATT